MAIPIWKDTYAEVTADSVNYDITTVGGEVIYHGSAVRNPAETKIYIKVNDVIADYIHQNLPSLTNYTYSEDSDSEATFYVVDCDTSVTLASLTFNYDWSYDESWDNTEALRSFPINGVVSNRQWFLTSYNNAPNVICVVINLIGGGQQFINVPVNISDGDYNDDYNDDYFNAGASLIKNGTLALDLSQWPGASSIEVRETDNTGTLLQRYDVRNECEKYALHYVNAYGGWDSLLVGATIISDMYTRYTAKHSYDNSVMTSRGTRNYANEIKHKYEIRTGWLLGSAGERMHHLLGSTDVYLEDLVTKEVKAVVLTDNQCEYKKFTNGHQLVSYTINAELAQDRVRL